jgi:hypothetical protein
MSPLAAHQASTAGRKSQHRQAHGLGHLAQQRRKVLGGGREQAARQQHLAREAIAHHPEHLVADIRLQAVEGQDDPALAPQHPPQPARVGQVGGEQLVVAVEQVGDAALGNLHPAPAQGGVDLRHAAVLAVAQHPDQGDDIQPELLLRQRQRALRLRPVRDMEARAARTLTPADP